MKKLLFIVAVILLLATSCRSSKDCGCPNGTGRIFLSIL